MIRIVRRFSVIIFSCVAAVCMTNCKKENFSDGSQIILCVSAADGTKSTITNTGTLQLAGEFVMDAYLDEEYTDYTVNPPIEYNDKHFIASNSLANVVYRNNAWGLVESKNWISNDMTRFWCYFPVTTNGTRVIDEPLSGAKATTITYTMPSSGSTDDLLFAYSSKRYNQKTDSKIIDITFHHAMSQIRFAVSTNDGSFDKNLSIKSITLKNIPSTGTCIFTGKDDMSGDASFVWTPGSSKSNYSETFNASFSPKVSSDWINYGYDKNSEHYTLYVANNSIFVIPHTLSSAKIEVVFESEGNQKTIEQNIPAVTWLPDTYYTYKINATTVGRDINASFTLLDWVHHDDKIIL